MCQRRIMKLVKGMENRYCEEQIWKLTLFILEQKRRDLTFYNLKEAVRQVGVGLFYQVTSDRT